MFYKSEVSVIKRLLFILFLVAVAVAMGGCCNTLYADIVSNGNDNVSGYWANPMAKSDTSQNGMMIFSHDQSMDIYTSSLAKDPTTLWYSVEYYDNSISAHNRGVCKKIDDTHYQITVKYIYRSSDDYRISSSPTPVIYRLVKINNSSYLYNVGSDMRALDESGVPTSGNDPGRYSYKLMGYSRYS
jgi:hypothetical protein